MIRHATIDDIPAIMQLLTQVLRIHNEGRPDLFKENGTKYSPAELAEIICDESTPVFVYTDHLNQVLGHCFCQFEETGESGARYACRTLYIDDLCVDEQARRRHVGTSLYEYVKAFARERGVHNITLHAWALNPGAVEFYRRLGMQVQSYTLEEVLE